MARMLHQHIVAVFQKPHTRGEMHHSCVNIDGDILGNMRRVEELTNRYAKCIVALDSFLTQ